MDVWKSHVTFLLRHTPKVKKKIYRQARPLCILGIVVTGEPARGGVWRLVSGAGGCARRGHVTPCPAAIARYKSTSAWLLGLFPTAELLTSLDAFGHGRYVVFLIFWSIFIRLYPTRSFARAPTNFWNALSKSPRYLWLNEIVFKSSV